MTPPLIIRLAGNTPTIDETAWVAPNATLIGRVTLGAESSVWYGAVLRGDLAPIVIGSVSFARLPAVRRSNARPLAGCAPSQK